MTICRKPLCIFERWQRSFCQVKYTKEKSYEAKGFALRVLMMAIFWTPKPGTHMLRFVDAQGRSASQRISVIASE